LSQGIGKPSNMDQCIRVMLVTVQRIRAHARSNFLTLLAWSGLHLQACLTGIWQQFSDSSGNCLALAFLLSNTSKVVLCFPLQQGRAFAEDEGSGSSQNQGQVVFSSNLNPKTFCFDFTAAARTSEILATFNNCGDWLGDCPATAAEEASRGDCVMLATRRSTSSFLKSSTLVAGRGDKGEGAILCLFFFFFPLCSSSAVAWASHMVDWRIHLQGPQWEPPVSMVGAVDRRRRGSTLIDPQRGQQQGLLLLCCGLRKAIPRTWKKKRLPFRGVSSSSDHFVSKLADAALSVAHAARCENFKRICEMRAVVRDPGFFIDANMVACAC
jgi:hypothetical protein